MQKISRFYIGTKGEGIDGLKGRSRLNYPPMWWNLIGWLFVALGFIGAFLPIMPTVPFLLLAAFCFEKGSPRLHKWIMEHKTFGPPLVNWREHRVIRPKAKIMAVLGITLSLTYMIFFRSIDIWLKVLISAICGTSMFFILIQRNHPPNRGEDKNGI